MILHDVLDDAEPEPRAPGVAAATPGARAWSTRKKRSKIRPCSSSGMPMPWSVTTISTAPSSTMTPMPTRDPSGE
jgi:hypothetical protein